MPNCQVYDPEFFQGHLEDSWNSARVVVPIVCGLVRPSSVIDVGCGSGTWLAVFRELGVSRVLGLDGDYVPRSSLAVPPDCFQVVDLNEQIPVNEKFDLALCLAVAEHLPRRSAPCLVGSLVKLAPVVLFSAAVPLQGGTNHVNEQWPEYWASLFWEFRYTRRDVIRRQIWNDSRVAWWYRQNVFLFVHYDHLDSYPGLAETGSGPDDLIMVRAEILKDHLCLRRTLRRLPGRLLSAAARRFRGRNGTA